jgi:hypothetical protein
LAIATLASAPAVQPLLASNFCSAFVRHEEPVHRLALGTGEQADRAGPDAVVGGRDAALAQRALAIRAADNEAGRPHLRHDEDAARLLHQLARAPVALL